MHFSLKVNSVQNSRLHKIEEIDLIYPYFTSCLQIEECLYSMLTVASSLVIQMELRERGITGRSRSGLNYSDKPRDSQKRLVNERLLEVGMFSVGY